MIPGHQEASHWAAQYRFCKALFLSFVLTFAIALQTYGQATSPKTNSDQQVRSDILVMLIKTIKTQPDVDSKGDIVSVPSFYLPYIVSSQSRGELLHAFQEQRTDQEVTTATSGSQGSTSVTNKGSVPWILGVAVEHGAVTQSVDGNQTVFRGNIANAISAIKFHDYYKSFEAIEEQNDIVRSVAKTSFSIQYNTTSQSNASPALQSQSNNFAGFSTHFDIYNHRDPRDKKWTENWASTITKLVQVSNSTAAFRTALFYDPQTKKMSVQQFDDWRTKVKERFTALYASGEATDDQLKSFIVEVANGLSESLATNANAQLAAENVAKSLLAESTEKSNAYNKIMSSPTFSFEYTLSRQSASQVPNATQAGTVTVGAPLPDLSNFNFIVNAHLVAEAQLAINASTTIFNSIPTGTNTSRVRDFRLAAQCDIGLPKISDSLGKPTLTFSGLYLDLLQQPLGQSVLVNDVPVNQKGNIGVFQTKVTFPAGKGSGVNIPISFTYANRTELIKESDVRGQIGVTFNLDSLFSKPQ